MPVRASPPGGSPVVTLLTDFGTADYYVAAVKGVLLRLAPGATLVDVGHQVPAGDVEAAGWLLAAASRWYPPGSVHLAVVDPGVGSARRILAAAAGGQWYVAPDNGLLTPLLAAAESAEQAPVVRAVERHDLYLPGPGATFHGRDRFAPVAAYLARGDDPAALGPPIADAVRLPAPPPRAEAGRLVGRVVHVDRFGNLVTDLPSAWLEGRGGGGEDGGAPGAGPVAEVDGHRCERSVTHYRQLPPGEPGLLPGSLGTLELSLDGESLADRWQVGRGARVTVRLPAEEGVR